MPKAPSHIYDFPQSRKNEIGPPWQFANVQPITKPQRVNHPPNDHFRRRVLRLHRGHDPRTLGVANVVGHFQKTE